MFFFLWSYRICTQCCESQISVSVGCVRIGVGKASKLGLVHRSQNVLVDWRQLGFLDGESRVKILDVQYVPLWHKWKGTNQKFLSMLQSKIVVYTANLPLWVWRAVQSLCDPVYPSWCSWKRVDRWYRQPSNLAFPVVSGDLSQAAIHKT